MTLRTNMNAFLHGEKPIKEPVFLKEGSSAEQQLANLRALYAEARGAGAPEELLADIERDGKLVDYGIAGEKQLAFELANSHMPLIVIHDLYLEHGGLSAQIDYLVFTRHIALVLECKNLYGDITINERGDFVRAMQYGGYTHKEGIYSPITQLQRHLELVKQMGADGKGGLAKLGFEHWFDDNFKSLVVLANPKTVLHDRYAPAAVREKVVRADKLIETVKRMDSESKNTALTDRELRAWAERWLSRGSECPTDYAAQRKAALEEWRNA